MPIERERTHHAESNLLFHKVLLNQLDGESTLADTTAAHDHNAILLSVGHAFLCSCNVCGSTDFSHSLESTPGVLRTANTKNNTKIRVQHEEKVKLLLCV
jgi:hypothetical protein